MMKSKPLYVQYGCGSCAPLEWINFDASPRLRLERLPVSRPVIRMTVGLQFAPNVHYGNIELGLPVSDNSAAGVYCSHVLEHLSRDAISIVLRHTIRILSPGGRFRLVVPDLFWRARDYVGAAENRDPYAADRFLNSCMLGTKTKAHSLVAAMRRTYGLSAHQWMYDFASLRLLLEDAGFSDIRQCELGDSGDAMFALVEDLNRFFEGEERELAIEAVRPA